MQDNTRKKLALILGAACLLLAALCWVFRPLFTDAPFSTAYAFDGPSGVFPGESGRLYIIDQGKKTVLITDGQGKLLRSNDCGTDGDSEPYYASLVAEGADGRAVTLALSPLVERVLGRKWSATDEQIDWLDQLAQGRFERVSALYSAWRELLPAMEEDLKKGRLLPRIFRFLKRCGRRWWIKHKQARAQKRRAAEQNA